MKIFGSGLVAMILVMGLVGCPPSLIGNSVTVFNYSYDEIITGVYISPTYSSSWGVNQIYYTLWPGDSATIYNIPNDCYDILIEGDSGLYWETYDVCLFNGDNFTLTLSGKKEIEISAKINDTVTYQKSYSQPESDTKKER